MSWKLIKSLREKQAKLRTDAETLMKTSEVEKRNLNPDEHSAIEAILTEVKDVQRSLDTAEKVYDFTANENKSARDLLGRDELGTSTTSNRSIAFGIEKRMVDAVADKSSNNGFSSGLSIGKYIRGIVTGDWSNAEAEQRAMSISTLASGGYLVPTSLSLDLIDLARNKSKVFVAGAQTVPMDSSTLRIARQTSDPTSGWKAENAPFASSDLVFDAVDFKAKTLGAIAKVSIELSEDARNIDAVISKAMSDALAVELDRVVLRGAGSTTEPMGIKDSTGVQKMLAVGEVGYSDFSQAIQKIWEANGEPNSIIYAPRTAGTLDRLVDSTGQPLTPPPSFQSMSKLVTNQVPINLGTGSNESEAYIGDFRQVLVGIRTNIVIEATRVASDAFENGQVWIRAYLRGDVQLARPSHFAYMDGITVPA